MLAVDLTTPAFIADPYPTYRELRQAAPLFPLMPGAWLVTRYRLADALLRDPRFGKDYMSSVQRRYGAQRAGHPVFATINRFLLVMNPPEHSRLRALISKAFSIKQAPDLRRLAQACADRLVDGFCRDGRADLVAAFAYPLPIAVICSLLGVRMDHALLFQSESQALIKVFELAPLDDDALHSAHAAAQVFDNYFRDLLTERRQRPGDDLISLLLKTEDGHDRLSEDEIIANIIQLFLAGHETTANMIGNALLALFKHPEQLAKLRGDWSLLPGAVSEALRYDSSVHLAARVALEAVDIEGIQVAQGDNVFINLGAANRDPAVFEDPDSFCITRGESAANPLSFGGGAHYCLGARLARIELETALATLLQRLPGLQLEELDTPHWRATTTVRGVEQLWAHWHS